MFDSMLGLFGEKSGLTFVYNYLLQGQPDLFNYYPKFLNLPAVRKMLHVGNLKYEDISTTVYSHRPEKVYESLFHPSDEGLASRDSYLEVTSYHKRSFSLLLFI